MGSTRRVEKPSGYEGIGGDNVLELWASRRHLTGGQDIPYARMKELLEALVAHDLVMVERKPAYTPILPGDNRLDQIEFPSQKWMIEYQPATQTYTQIANVQLRRLYRQRQRLDNTPKVTRNYSPTSAAFVEFFETQDENKYTPSKESCDSAAKPIFRFTPARVELRADTARISPN
jgi:hypothetical protein